MKNAGDVVDAENDDDPLDGVRSSSLVRWVDFLLLVSRQGQQWKEHRSQPLVQG